MKEMNMLLSDCSDLLWKVMNKLSMKQPEINAKLKYLFYILNLNYQEVIKVQNGY